MEGSFGMRFCGGVDAAVPGGEAPKGILARNRFSSGSRSTNVVRPSLNVSSSPARIALRIVLTDVRKRAAVSSIVRTGDAAVLLPFGPGEGLFMARNHPTGTLRHRKAALSRVMIPHFLQE